MDCRRSVYLTVRRLFLILKVFIDWTSRFFVLDELESKKDYPKLLHWFFTFDCADLIWRVLGIFSIPRPRYRSDEFKERLHNSTFVPMTGYRILVSTTVVLLGSTKAVLAFLGNNTTSNYLDWTLAVFIASLSVSLSLLHLYVYLLKN